MEDKNLLMRRFAVIRRIAELAPDPGKINIQKIIYFLQNDAGVSLDYRFKMHHYGPYSVNLDNNLSLANAMGIVEVTPDSNGHGYHVSPGQYDVEVPAPPIPWKEIDEKIHNLGGLELWRLELLATAHFVKSLRPQLDESQMVRTVLRLKPKFSEQTISEACSSLYE